MTTTDVETATGVLTNNDILAMRRADDITLHHHKGRGYLRAHMRGGYDTTPRVWSTHEQRVFSTPNALDRYREIPVDTHIAGSGVQYGKRVECFEMLHASNYSDVWQTVVSLMRTGDLLRLHWIADGNQCTKDAGLHIDTVSVALLGRPRRVRFLLRTSVCPDNTARMIRIHG